MSDPQATEVKDVNKTDASGENNSEQGVEGQLDFKECCFVLRKKVDSEKRATRMLLTHPAIVGEKPGYGEMIANIMLAYRHLEDARMRLGKAVQAFDGGESCYPR